jgi:branched-subunit amino acid aminotransferase/4-amino-4-deoxychorismate lyase
LSPQHPIAFLNGRWLPADELAIPIFDAGFVLGATVTEQLRTFRGQIFRLQDHLHRLFRSLEITGIDPGHSSRELADIATQIAAHNHALLDAEDDLGLGMFVTPGAYAPLAAGQHTGSTVCVYSYPLAFGMWAEKYQQGDAVVVSDIMQVPPTTWPPELKCRSRMHYFLADRRARAVDSMARAILLDERGCVSETSTANVVMYVHAEGLASPPRERILPGISLMTLQDLAQQRGIPFVHRDIHRRELAGADELLLTSTSVCVLPVVRCDGQPVGSGTPGDVYHKLLAAWNELVGLNIPQQAARFAKRW